MVGIIVDKLSVLLQGPKAVRRRRHMENMEMKFLLEFTACGNTEPQDLISLLGLDSCSLEKPVM